MGWATGSELMERIIVALEDSGLKPTDKRVLYVDLINIFLDFDCDTLGECVGADEEFDAAYAEILHDYTGDDDEPLDDD